MADDDPKVIPFVLGVPSMTFRERGDNPKRSYCKHWSISVYPDEPIIECRDCGAIVDPYYWLRQSIGRWDGPLRDRKSKISQLDDEIESRKSALRMIKKEYATEAEKRRAERAIAVLPNGRTHR